MGRGRLGILFRHILSNVILPIVIRTAVCLSYGILIKSALSYLGVGVQPPTPAWGTILNEGKSVGNISLLRHRPPPSWPPSP